MIYFVNLNEIFTDLCKMQQWYIIQFKPNAHNLAERNLRRQGFKTFLPLQEVTNRKASRFTNNLKPLFPGYMFVGIAEYSAPLSRIKNTLGVSSLVSFDSRPHQVPNELIAGLMLRCDNSGIIIPQGTLSKGDSVEILKGPFASFIAKVETVDSEQRVWIMMELMGHHAKVKVAAEQIRCVL